MAEAAPAELKHSPSEVSQKFCAVCEKTSELKSCGRCRNIWYCCKEHQVGHWRAHKLGCNNNGEAESLSNIPVHRQTINGETDLCGTSKVEELDSADSLGDVIDSMSLAAKVTDISNHDDGEINPRRLRFDQFEGLPSNVPSHITAHSLQQHACRVVPCLYEYGIAVIDDFLGQELSLNVLKEVAVLNREGQMADGQTTAPHSLQKKYRTDKIVWVTGGEEKCVAISSLISIIDAMMRVVADELVDYRLKGRTQAMVACYPAGGSRYVRHVDNPSRDGRLLTCIYYLNKNWNVKEDGGVLKIYPEGCDRVASIAPILDRLLVFWSDKRNPHEVLPAYRTRYAVTLWYFDVNERDAATHNNK